MCRYSSYVCVCVQWDTFWKSELNARPMMTHPCIVYAHVALIGNISTTHSIHTIAAQTLATNHLVVSSFVPIDRKYINSNSEPCKYLPHSRCRHIEREKRWSEKNQRDSQCLFPYAVAKIRLLASHSFIHIFQCELLIRQHSRIMQCVQEHQPLYVKRSHSLARTHALTLPRYAFSLNFSFVFINLHADLVV